MVELIFVIETRSSNRSDWMYIKSALDFYYKPGTYGISKIFAKCKTELIKQEKKIESAIKNTNRKPVVIVCADFDRDEEINDRIIDYCNANNYNLVWMNIDVEDVFWREKIENKHKKSKAIAFQKKKDQLLPEVKGLDTTNPLKERHTSNLLVVCDKYLKRK